MLLGMTKQEVANLSAEEQEALAKIALNQFRFERATLEKAKGYRGSMLFPFMVINLMAAGVGWMVFRGGIVGGEPLIVIGFIFGMTIGLIQFHAKGLNKRIDAVLRLMQLEKEEAERSRVQSTPVTDGSDWDEKPPH